MNKNKYVCCICGKHCEGYGNNPWPIDRTINARCCDYCNMHIVVPERIKEYYKETSNDR